jgi:hypothetical protein
MAGLSAQTPLVTPAKQAAPAFPVSSTDLLQTAISSTSDGLTYNSSYNPVEKNYSDLIDGDAGGEPVIESGTLTFTLDTTVNTLGYDVTTIQTFTDHPDGGRDGQDFAVGYSTVSAPATFVPIASVSHLMGDNATEGKGKVTISNIGASHVAAIRFHFATQENFGSTWSEIDIFGTPAVTMMDATDYDVWADSYSLVGSVDDDDDGDGLTNGEEYAFGLLPNSTSSCNPILTPLDRVTGKFLYARREAAITGYDYTIWTSTDLSSWSEDTGATQRVIDLWNEIETVEATVSAGRLASPSLFIKVKAELPPP